MAWVDLATFSSHKNCTHFCLGYITLWPAVHSSAHFDSVSEKNWRCDQKYGCAEYALAYSGIGQQRQTTCLQVEAYAALEKYREADAALQSAGRKSASFRETKEYKSLSSQLKAALQGLRR